ncbi:hypothetical protein EAF04_006434 [Stromatinia cepivora]|nr:hypothetical protein EAF04_006434 [Stromatinia cepivora]
MAKGGALLPTLIDERALQEPDRLYCAFLKSEDINDGVVKVSYINFANAVNRLAWFVEETFGKSDNFSTIGYIGPSDIRYGMLALAAVKTGHKALLMSLYNPVPAQLNLLEVTKCQNILVAADFPSFKPILTAILARRPMKCVEMESVSHWIAKGIVPHYPFSATLAECPHRLFVVLHTSGFPSAITYTFAALTAYRKHASPRDAPPDAPMSSQEAWIDHWSTPHDSNNLLLEHASHPRSRKRLAQSRACHSNSQPRFLSSRRPFPGFYASHDSQTRVSRKSPNTRIFEKFLEDLYEIVIVKNEKILHAQFIFLNNPEVTEWRSKDLFSKHPEKQGLWKYSGRTDDMIVLSTGYNINPTPMENIVASHAEIKTALLIRAGRPKCVWLLEMNDPPTTDDGRDNLKKRIWPMIEKANEMAPLPARVEWREGELAVVIARKEKPFPRAGKESVQRKLAVREYEKEIEDFFKEFV